MEFIGIAGSNGLAVPSFIIQTHQTLPTEENDRE
jgi:hypothetical protein